MYIDNRYLKQFWKYIHSALAGWDVGTERGTNAIIYHCKDENVYISNSGDSIAQRVAFYE